MDSMVIIVLQKVSKQGDGKIMNFKLDYASKQGNKEWLKSCETGRSPIPADKLSRQLIL